LCHIITKKLPMEKVSTLLEIAFIVITLLSVWQFYRATNQSKLFLIIMILWMAVQFFSGNSNFYINASSGPPRVVFLIFPPLILITLLFIVPQGRIFINNLKIKELTLLHAIRIPVEIALFFLYLSKTIPEIMTFEGRNFDIIAGLTAPIITYFGFNKNKISDKLLIVWNVICLGLLLNIVRLALLSSKTPFQQFGFDQPNIAIGHFPFNWLPSVIVPLVLFSHLVVIRRLSSR
jgi:hypothetical protein